MIFKYMRISPMLVIDGKGLSSDAAPPRPKTVNRSRANEAAVLEYRAAAIEAREADARFAAAEARVASTIAAVDDEYGAAASAAAAAARAAVSIAKTKGEDIAQYEGTKKEAEDEYKRAMDARTTAEARVAEAEATLKHDVELAALAYALAEEDTLEKEIAMALLEESEIKIVSRKYNVEDPYTRVKYKKEKMAVNVAEEEVREALESKNAAEIEVAEARKEAEHLANYIAEYEEFNEVGLVDKRYKKLAADAKEKLKDATVKSIEAAKELEELTRKLAIEQEEAVDIMERSEVYREVQERLQEPLHQAEIAKNRGIKLPHEYEEEFSAVVESAAVDAEAIGVINARRREVEVAINHHKKWGAIKIVMGLALAASSVYFGALNADYYLSFAIPCFITGLSIVGFGVKEREEADKYDRGEGELMIDRSFTRSLSQSLIHSLTQPSKGNLS